MNICVTESVRYLNFPVTEYGPKSRVRLLNNGREVFSFRLKLTDGVPDYWVAADLKRYEGESLTVEIRDFGGEKDPLSLMRLSDHREGNGRIYKEDLRPKYHFSAICGWLNDPNGLMYYRGQWHAFCQINPFYRWCENMHWMQLTSSDLIHWKDCGEVLFPDETGEKWSGSGVVDEENVTGLQKGEEKTLLLFYTAAGKEFTQNMAYSNDAGKTWKLYEHNPVLKEQYHGNRDPKVIRRPDGRGWWMALYLKDNDYALFYSENLLNWEKTCVLTLPGCLECPDIYEIALDGNPNDTRMIFSCAGGQYLVGKIENNQFISETEIQTCYKGQDVYAPQSFYGVPEGRRVQIICSSNGTMLPGEAFGKFLTVPCELTLKTLPGGPALMTQPVRELRSLEKEVTEETECLRVTPDKPYVSPNPRSGLFRLELQIDASYTGKIEFELYNLCLIYDGSTHGIIRDGKQWKLTGNSQTVSFDFMVDRCSVELFMGDGEIYLPCNLPLDLSRPPLKITADGETMLKYFRLVELKSTLPWSKI